MAVLFNTSNFIEGLLTFYPHHKAIISKEMSPSVEIINGQHFSQAHRVVNRKV